jgi:glycerophosphoryl diester phosphodiesterase
MNIAHRGLWNHQNKVVGILKVSSYVQAIEVDVRKNSQGVLVLCHDKDRANDDDNDTLEELCKVHIPLHIILDIKGNYAREVLEVINKSHHIWKLSSFDYRCVNDLIKLSGYEIGIITEGAPSEEILKHVDFVTQDYEFFDSEMLKMYREYNLDVYIFNTLKEVDGVDGIIKNIFFDILN